MVERFLLYPAHVFSLMRLRKDIFKKVSQLKARVFKSDEPVLLLKPEALYLQVGSELAFCATLGVGNIVSDHPLLSSYLTNTCHIFILLYYKFQRAANIPFFSLNSKFFTQTSINGSI